jgi:hypothetical protein
MFVLSNFFIFEGKTSKFNKESVILKGDLYFANL